MLIQLERVGLRFNHPDGDQDKTADVIEALAACTLSEEAFVAWLKDQVQS
jgi:prophage maintenance system killer protein